MENKEINKEINSTAKKEPQQNKDKPLSSFTPINENKHINSAFKNLKSEIKSENIFPNGTPRKQLNSEYFNSIISPFKDYPFPDTPFKHANYNISSPENLRFNSPMNGKFYF